MKTDLSKFWRIYRAVRRGLHRREVRAVRRRMAANLAAYLTT
jgi:hypothetical protein